MSRREHYAIRHPVRLEWSHGIDGEVTLDAIAADGARLSIMASHQRWADLLLTVPRDRVGEVQAMFVRDEIDVDGLERILDGERGTWPR